MSEYTRDELSAQSQEFADALVEFFKQWPSPLPADIKAQLALRVATEFSISAWCYDNGRAE